MKFPESSQVDTVVSTLVSSYLTLGERANLTDSALAELGGISKMTLYKWRKTLPDRRLTTMNFINLLAATKCLNAGLKSGALPAVSRATGRKFVTEARKSAQPPNTQR